jgi:DNA-binding phage protein
MSHDERERKLNQARGVAAIRSLHVRGLAEAGAARAAALAEADKQLDRIARLLHDALEGGVAMTEIARVTGVSRQTLYELRGRYGDTADLRLAVLQAALTRYPANADDIAEYLRRPEGEIKPLLVELADEGLIELEYELHPGGSDAPYGISADGVRALEVWSMEGDAGQRRTES